MADITYLPTHSGETYVSLVTDAYSRKIVGYQVDDNMKTNSVKQAFRQALRNRQSSGHFVHHSDRGIQYCSNVYTNELKRKGIKISMTEEKHCYENAMAERVNGILKDEFYLDQTFISIAHAKKATKNAIKLYNSKRLHLSLDFNTPNSIHLNAA